MLDGVAANGKVMCWDAPHLRSFGRGAIWLASSQVGIFSPTQSPPFAVLDGESFFRAIGPWQNRPFLSLLRDAGYCGTTTSKVPTILERCIVLELRAKQIYKALAKAFDDQGMVGFFFAGLADQEQYHADLLDVCRSVRFKAAGRPTCLIPGRITCPGSSSRWMPRRPLCIISAL